MKKTLPASDPTFDYLPPTAGVRLPKEMQHPMPPLGAKPTSPLNKHILRLRALHPEIEWKYQPEEIVKLDEASLKALLREVNQKLGIR